MSRAFYKYSQLLSYIVLEIRCVYKLALSKRSVPWLDIIAEMARPLGVNNEKESKTNNSKRNNRRVAWVMSATNERGIRAYLFFGSFQNR